MSVTRRLVLGSALAAPALLTGCSGRSAGSAGGSPEGSSEAGRRLATAVGVVTVRGDAAGMWNSRLVEAAHRVQSVWGVSPRRLEITFCATDEDFEASASGLGDLTAAVTTPTGIFVGPNVRDGLDRAGQVVVLAHEITHAVLGHVGHDPTALWVREGAAQWTAERDVTLPVAQLWPTLTARVRAGSGPGGPPGRDLFESDAALAYETATAYSAYLVEAVGATNWKTFVRSRPPERHAGAATQRLLEHHHPKSFTLWLRGRVSR